MKKFLIKSVLFSLIVVSVILSILSLYYSRFHSINGKPARESVFIWGDSQVKAAYNVEILGQIIDKKVYSAALGGAGVFDFLSFTEVVPDSSITIISISSLSVLRDRDKNQTGIPLYSIPFLFSHDFPNLLYSVRINLKPHSIFYTDNHLYPYRDSLTYHEPLSKFKDIYAQENVALETKELAYLYGIDRLLEKKCKVVCVCFPIHKYLDEIVPEDTKNDFTLFLNKIEKKLNVAKVDTIYFTDQNRNMYDLTHLNEKGANDFSLQLSDYIKSDKTSNGFIIINGGVSE